jgi:hypothetical protein
MRLDRNFHLRLHGSRLSEIHFEVQTKVCLVRLATGFRLATTERVRVWETRPCNTTWCRLSPFDGRVQQCVL